MFKIFKEKCMKHVIKLKKEGYKGLTKAWGQKPLKIGGRKSQKAWVLDWSRHKKTKGERKVLKKTEEHVREGTFCSFLSKFYRLSTDRVPIEPSNSFPLKILKILIGRKLVSINQKIDLIDWAPIEHQSNQAEPSLKN